ncbi:low-density lipoprotein receptor-related protein 8-like [Anneissia japonica]|uniref:low-density lipoprotein receptor-related protein 8-like n=1 Tax=Anneissia japonica TaxID=1529436 RepID=UPI00142553F6|nr:low-density lipoprotein receptor-related protein 8-like [Anneissia japonica]
MARNCCIIMPCILVFLVLLVIGLSLGSDVIVATGSFPPSILISNIKTDDTVINFTTVYSMVNRPSGIVYDEISSTIYWKDSERLTIERYFIENGTHDVFLTPSAISKRGIAIDVSDRKLYWVEDDASIYSINLDRTGRTFITSSDCGCTFDYLQVDSTNRYIYWINHSATNMVSRGNLDADGDIADTIAILYSSISLSGLSISNNGQLQNRKFWIY